MTNKTRWLLVTSALILGITLPTIAVQAAIQLQPHVVDIPQGSISLSDSDIDVMRDKTPCGAQPLPSCGTLGEKSIAGQIYFHEATGALYQLHGEMEGAIYTVRFILFLPNGIYRSVNKVFLVANGRRIKLTKGQAVDKTITAATTGAAWGMTQANIDLMIDKNSACYNAAEEETCLLRADSMNSQFSGQLIMSSDTGAVYYVPQGGTPLQARPHLDNGDSWYETMRDLAGNQPIRLIHKLPSGKRLGFVR